ncbi:MAG TPA: methionyl-tRNA formyltransferase [Pyrinomonadaceae bacterium]
MRVVFMGTPESAVRSLHRLIEDGHEVVSVWTQPDKPAGRGDKIHFPPVKRFALAHGLKLEQPTKLRTDEAKGLFSSYDADVAVVVASGRILPREFLTAPRRGCVNVHFSLLPKYRGAAPANWAIVNGEKQTGVTTMFIEEELDSGPILLQRETAIGETETASQLMERLSVIGADLLSQTLRELDTITPRQQTDEEATLAPILTREHGLIDWRMPAVDIERRVRGFQPWPNAHTQHKGKRLIIWAAEVSQTSADDARPGQVIEASGENLVVKTGNSTALKILELQPESKRRMQVLDFLNGSHLQVGESFG